MATPCSATTRTCAVLRLPGRGIAGRVPLVKEVRFADFEIAVTWHTADMNIPHRYTSSVNISVVFAFTRRGTAAQSPARNANA